MNSRMLSVNVTEFKDMTLYLRTSLTNVQIATAISNITSAARESSVSYDHDKVYEELCEAYPKENTERFWLVLGTNVNEYTSERITI